MPYGTGPDSATARAPWPYCRTPGRTLANGCLCRQVVKRAVIRDCVPIDQTHMVSRLITAYRATHPKVRVDDLCAEHILNVEKRAADVAFCASESPIDDRLIVHRLRDRGWAC